MTVWYSQFNYWLTFNTVTFAIFQRFTFIFSPWYKWVFVGKTRLSVCDLSAPASQMLGLGVCATTPAPPQILTNCPSSVLCGSAFLLALLSFHISLPWSSFLQGFPGTRRSEWLNYSGFSCCPQCSLMFPVNPEPRTDLQELIEKAREGNDGYNRKLCKGRFSSVSFGFSWTDLSLTKEEREAVDWSGVGDRYMGMTPIFENMF